MFRIGQEEIDAVAEVIRSGELFKINDGAQVVLNTEKKMNRIFGCKHSILMSSGYAALVTALIGMGVGPGDQVIVPAYTYIASAMAVVAAGAIPVIAEVDETLTLSVEDVEKKITPHTKAILPVHIQGFPCDMDGILALAKKYNLMVLEDACQADGGTFKGKRLGTFGDAGALSFNFFKIISCGDGGALFTNDDKIYERALIHHDASAIAFFGDQIDKENAELFCGNEYRVGEITGAIMNVQLDRLDGILADLRKNKKYLKDNLAPYCKFLPSHDEEGDCATTLALKFDTVAQAEAFCEKFAPHGCSPINTGKHIYKNWDSIMMKKGACHPLMDPFKMEANKDIIPDYTADMCPKTLELLATTVYTSIKADWTKEAMDQRIEAIKAALN